MVDCVSAAIFPIEVGEETYLKSVENLVLTSIQTFEARIFAVLNWFTGTMPYFKTTT